MRLCSLAYVTVHDEGLHLCIEIRPPEVASQQIKSARNAEMSRVRRIVMMSNTLVSEV